MSVSSTYTTLSAQVFHQRLHEGFFAAVVDVCVPAGTEPNPAKL